MLWQIFIGHRSAWFPQLSACRLVEFDASVISMCLYIVKAYFYRKLCLKVSRNLLSRDKT